MGDMPLWKQFLLGVAVVAVVAGGVMSFIWGSTTATMAGSGGPVMLDTAPAASVDAGTIPAPEPAPENLPRSVFWLGVSYLAGFCSGVFLRAVVKSALIAVSFWFLMTIILSYAEMVVVDWSVVNSLWARFNLMVEREWGNLESFVLGSLSAICVATAGVATGLRRH